VDKFKEFTGLDNIVNKAIERAFSGSFLPHKLWKERDEILPACDLIDKGEYLLLRIEVPGLKKEDIEISVDETSIGFKGEVKKEQEEKDETYYRSERYYGGFAGAINLPVEINPSNVDAILTDGILEIKLPKKKVHKAKKIEIQVK